MDITKYLIFRDWIAPLIILFVIIVSWIICFLIDVMGEKIEKMRDKKRNKV